MRPIYDTELRAEAGDATLFGSYKSKRPDDCFRRSMGPQHNAELWGSHRAQEPKTDPGK